MRAYVKTRGFPRHLDYGFLGEAPPERWWKPLEDRELVDLEAPETLARGAGGALGVLVGGLPSARRDVLGTRIRHTLVVDGLESDPALAVRLAAAALDPGARDRLGKELDALLPGELVDAVLSGEPGGAEVGGLLEELLASSGWAAEPEPESGQGPGAPDRAGSWAAPLGDPDGRAAFLARVAALADGRDGHAFVTHALDTVPGARRAADALAGDVAILLADAAPGEVVALGKAVDAAAAPARPGVPVSTLTAVLGSAVLIAMIALAILWR